MPIYLLTKGATRALSDQLLQGSQAINAELCWSSGRCVDIGKWLTISHAAEFSTGRGPHVPEGTTWMANACGAVKWQSNWTPNLAWNLFNFLIRSACLPGNGVSKSPTGCWSLFRPARPLSSREARRPNHGCPIHKRDSYWMCRQSRQQLMRVKTSVVSLEKNRDMRKRNLRGAMLQCVSIIINTNYVGAKIKKVFFIILGLAIFFAGFQAPIPVYFWSFKLRGASFVTFCLA